MRMVSRYHPLLVVLHWLLAILILMMLFGGFFGIAPMSNADPQKVDVLLVHMAMGMAILALMALRLVIRVATAKPADAGAGHPALDRLVPVVHYGFYLIVALMAATGLGTAIIAGLNRSVFQHSGEPLPPSFDVYPTFTAHSWLALLLAAFVLLHVLAALYHQLFRRDRLMRRMWFGRRTP